MKTRTSLTVAILSLLLTPPATTSFGQTSPHTVEAAVKPGGKWVAYPTRTLADVPGAATLEPDTGLSRYGGLMARKEKATARVSGNNMATAAAAQKRPALSHRRHWIARRKNRDSVHANGKKAAPGMHRKKSKLQRAVGTPRRRATQS